MADQIIERQALGNPLSASSVPVKQHSAATVDRSFRQVATPVGPAEDILGTLVESSGQVMTAAGQHLARKVDEDKSIQTLRFYQGMAPSDDATLAGYRAHSVVGMQNSVLEQTARLKSEATTFEGTDEEWEDRVRAAQASTYDTTMTKYPALAGDNEARKALNAIFGEQIPQVAAARVGAKLAQEHDQRIVSLQDNILARTEGLPVEEQYKVLNATMSDTSAALRLTKKDREAVLVAIAKQKALAGDLTFLGYTEHYTGGAQSSLFDRTPGLHEAKVQGKLAYDKAHQGEIAAVKQKDVDDLNANLISREEWFKLVDKRNQQFSNLAWTDESAMAALAASIKPEKDKPWQNAGLFASDKLADLTRLNAGEFKDSAAWFNTVAGTNEKRQGPVWTAEGALESWNKAQEDAIKKVDLAPYVNQFYSPAAGNAPLGQTEDGIKYNDDIIAGAKQVRDRTVAAQIAANTSQAQAIKDRAQREYVTYLGKERLEDKSFSKLLNSIQFTDISDAKNMKNLAPGVEQAITLYNSMPQSAKDVHVPDKKLQALYENFGYFLDEGFSRVGAMEKAVYSMKHPENVTDQRRKAIGEEALKAADAQTSRYATLAGYIPFGGETTAPDWYKEIHRDEVYKMTLANTLSGVLDPKKAAALATAAFENNGTRLPNGMYLKGTPAFLAAKMKLAPEDIHKTVTAYLEMNKASLEDEGGVDIDQMYIETDPARGTFRVRTSLGDTLGKPMPLESMKRGAEAFIEEGKKSGLFSQAFSSFSRSETHDEDQDNIRRTIAFVEGNGGFDKRTGAFTPYQDGNGKQMNIGYGHRLTPEEQKRGYIQVDGQVYSLGTRFGASQVSLKVAEKILDNDLKESAKKLRKSWPGFDGLPAKYKGVLLNLDYNTGSASPIVWPKLKEAMLSGDDAAVRREMVTYYENPQGGKTYLKGRATIVADRLRLKK